MIGGIDVRLPSAAGLRSIEVAVRALRQYWPHAVVENGDSGERYGSLSQIPFGDVRELFVYRDGDAADLWDERGAIPEAANTMIHLLYDDGLITAVIDERNPEMEVILEAIRSELSGTLAPTSDGDGLK